MSKLVQAALAGLALGLLLTGSALADCAKCGGNSGCPTCGCHSKCGCASRSRCRCKSKSRGCCWGDQGTWYKCTDGCCPPQADTVTVCVPQDGCYKHPYEACYNGSSLLCDTGCSSYLPCKRVGLLCDTKCEERTTKDCCGCEHVEYVNHEECQVVERPRVVPWWFTGGKGNAYLDDSAAALPMVQDQAGGMKVQGAAGAPEKKAGEPDKTSNQDGSAGTKDAGKPADGSGSK
jgi:hypothetical protein